MSTSTEEAARNAVSAERLQRHLEWFAKVPRDTGGTGEHRAAAYMAEQLRADGVPVTVHEFDAFLSYPIRATLQVLQPEPLEIRCLTHSFGRSTGPNGIVAELGEGDLNDLAGKAALVKGLATPITILAASRIGLAAVVFTNEDWVIHNMIGTTIWGTPGLDQIDRLPSLPVVSVNREDGERLRALIARHDRVQIRLVTEVKTGWFPSKLPEVRIPGSQEPERFVLVGAHYCAWHEGITDNATGDACLLEMARVLWERRAELRRGVRICWWPGHSHGRYAGSTWYADTFFGDLARGCIAYHNIDSPGVKGATHYVARHTTAEVEDFCRTVIGDISGQKEAPIHRPSRAADQSFLANGVAAFSTYPFLPEGHEDRRPWTGGAANAWWWHTEYDTLDKADKDILRLDTQISLSAVIRLCTADVLPLRPSATVREIGAALRDIQAKSGDHLDLQPARAALDDLTSAVNELEGMRDRADQAAALNATLLRLGRILNPVVYSQGGRFSHDPAEWSPIMRPTGGAALSALGRAAGLPQLHGQPEYGFLKAQVVRERNRVTEALREAAAAARATGR
ncbi:MAG TPA: M28 family metallopeptidase [Bacillota bacterium]|nr:M28 family metallopeptidase [Bacillota bacterium]